MIQRVVVTVFTLVTALMFPATASAQRTLWGVTVTFSPIFDTAEFSKELVDANELTLEGKTFRIGFARGGALLSEWSLLFVQRSFNEGGVIDINGRHITNDGAKLTGVEIEKFAIKGNIKDRAVLGIIIAAGIGAVRGTLTADDGTVVQANDKFTFFGSGSGVHPLFRLEFGVGIIAARGLRLRASGGFDYPGYSATIGATYFFGDR